LLWVKASKSDSRIPLIVPNHPDSYRTARNVIKKMIRKSVEVASPQATRIEVEEPRAGACLSNANPELREEVVAQLFRDAVILLEDLVEVGLDTAVESSIHGALIR
jgi:hypothetical protein